MNNSHLHLPDIAFFQWCHSHFNVNKGVYNSIDTWFYEYGIKDILERRSNIETFLRFVKDSVSESARHKFLHFGNGGLSRKLSEYMQQRSENSF